MAVSSSVPKTPFCEPDRDCPRCERLVAFRAQNRAAWPDWFNAPVPTFGDPQGALLIVGLAPGLRGANRTGRPFTGDFAGDLLYPTLLDFGLAEGTYDARCDDGLTLKNCLISNAVRCVPPANKPTLQEQKDCRPFLSALLNNLPNLKLILSLGRISHEAVVRAHGHALSKFPFVHGAVHPLADHLTLVDCYHCSRYNTNTGRLTHDMFHAVFETVCDQL